VHRRQVDQSAALGGSKAGQAVTPATDRDLKTGARRELQRSGDVIAVSRPDDHRRTTIAEAVVSPTRVIVAVVVGEEEFPAKLTSQHPQGVAHTLAITSQATRPCGRVLSRGCRITPG
jgi:hypothetical protein